MGLFDDDVLDGQFQEKTFGPHEGVAGVLLGASACDGHIADEEVQSLMTTLSRMDLYQHVPPHKFSAMMDRILGVLKRGGPEKLLDKAVPAVPPELAETVFVNAIDVVLADGVVDEDEKIFIDSLMNRLEIDEKRAKVFVKVMVYKNKG